MSNEPTRPGRPSASPASSSTVAIVLAVIAAVVGFFVIKQVRDDNGSSSKPPTTTTPGTGTVAGDTLPAATVGSSAPTAPVTSGTSVVVANASSQNGVAGKLTTELQAQHFTLQKAANATAKSDTTHVYYDPANPAAKPVADTLASLMGVAASEALPATVPLQAGKLPDGCGVLVVLGADKAGKGLTEMGGTATTAVPTASTSAATTTTGG